MASFIGWVIFFFVFTAVSKTPRWTIADITARCIALSYGIHLLGDRIFAL